MTKTYKFMLTFTIKVGGQAVENASVTPADPKNQAEFHVELKAGDKVVISKGETVLGFYHWDEENQKAVKDGEEFVASKEGAHVFYVNIDGEIYVSEPQGGEQPVAQPVVIKCKGHTENVGNRHLKM